VATVVPCSSSLTAVGLTSAPTSSRSAVSNAAPGSSGVEGVFATRIAPSDGTATASVNVPPVSTATIQSWSGIAVLEFAGKGYYLLGENPHRMALDLPGQPRKVQPCDEVQVAAGRAAVGVDPRRDLGGGAGQDGGTKGRLFPRAGL